MKQQADPTPKTQKEALQRNFDDAEHIYREAAEEVTRLGGRVNAERKALDQLEDEYSAACRDFASGGSADTSGIVAEKDRRGDRLRGLEMLLKEATERLTSLHAAQAAAARALQGEIDRLETERLKAEIARTGSDRQRAQSALKDAQQAENNALWALRRFERQIEIAKEQEKLVAQGRA